MPQNRHKTGFRGPSPNVGKSTQFQHGNRANPGGRPRSAPLTDELRNILETLDPRERKTVARKIAEALVKQALKGSERHFRAIADRIEGKPAQRVEVTGKDGDSIAVRVEIEAVRAKLFAKLSRAPAQPKE